ncbi:MAG: pseudouridine synthase [Bradyrhizobiaceae bacterium]|nr:MAG: pseudouridine synthase [Bradyrhizobiaceae bacterium]
MPRNNDKNNGRPPRRGSGEGYKGGGKGRSSGPRSGSSDGRRSSRDDRPSRPAAARGERKFGDKKFGDRKSGDGNFGEKRSYKPRAERGDSPRPRFNRDERPQRDERPSRGPRKEFGVRAERSEGRTFRPREDRTEGRSFRPREDRGGDRPFKSRAQEDRAPRGERSEFRSSRNAGAGRFEDRKSGGGKFGEKRPYRARGERDDAPRPRFNRDDRPPRDRDERRPRAPRREFDGPGRSPEKPRQEKPWQKRAPAERSSEERQRFSRPRFDKPREDRAPRGERRGGGDWHEQARSERRSREDRPRRDNEDDSKVFAKRPAFGGRGDYRERKPDFDKRVPREAAAAKTKTGERIAKIVARAGLCSRRDAEEWIVQGRVAVNGRVINSPALDVTPRDVVTIDGKPLPERERTRLFLYHKPRGLMTTHDDPEGRPTVFDNLPEGLPRLISIGRLDFNTEGLLLLTNDGGLSRALEHPDTGWLRRYRVRAHGDVTQAQLDQLKSGVEVDGVKYGPIDATLERDQGSNVWIVFAIREGKNREVRNVMAHLGLEVNRLIRVSYGPFQLGEIAEGQVEEIKGRVLRDQLGDKIVALSGAQFDKPERDASPDDDAPRAKGRPKATGKNALIADSKGRRVLVTRSGSAEKRSQNEDESNGYGAPRRPKRGYHGKRDLKPRDL